MIATKKRMDLINEKQVFSTTIERKTSFDDKLYGKRDNNISINSSANTSQNKKNPKDLQLNTNLDQTLKLIVQE